MTKVVKTVLSQKLELPCGAVLKNRIAKPAMSDSLGDGTGNPTQQQIDLYGIWAEGGLSLSIIGEVQSDPLAAEKPGNLVLRDDVDATPFRLLSEAGGKNNTQLWLQLGHAGAMAHPPISDPRGPSSLEVGYIACSALELDEIAKISAEFARTAYLAKEMGFGGVQIHAAHGFLLSQFLSPLFNKRDDQYGGSIENRMRLTLEVISAVRDQVGPNFPIGIKLNATDHLEGGLTEEDALKVIAALNETSVDLIDISGGTYFPGARAASDTGGTGPYFLDFACRARKLTSKPLMLTGGFKTYAQAVDALAAGVDVIGLARALILRPELPNEWLAGDTQVPSFPRFDNPPQGGVTAWYTMRMTELAQRQDLSGPECLSESIRRYEARDAARVAIWNAKFRA